MLQRLSIAPAQGKAGNISEYLIKWNNKWNQTNCLSLRQSNEITEKAFNSNTKYTRYNTIAHTATINVQYQFQQWMINLNYQMDHILYQIFNIFLSMF